MKTEKLEKLYEDFNISNLGFGIVHDKLGDVYEKFCIQILETDEFLSDAKLGKERTDVEYNIYITMLNIIGITNFQNISRIGGSDPIPCRLSHGLSKTDIIAHIYYIDGTTKCFPISCKQSTVPKVAFAEFDVNTICEEIGITNQRLKTLLLKHQSDASAKNFTVNEKDELLALMTPIARNFVRWVITGSPIAVNNDLRIPISIIKFDLKRPKDRYNIDINHGDFELCGFKIYTIEDYIDLIMLDRNGKNKKGGFGTGLSWTYATGSKGTKIQFKG